MENEKVFIETLLNPKTQQAAFKQLVFQYQKPLYNHIRNIVLNHDDADDVLQNTFIKVFRNLSKFKGESKLFSWIYRIATNESLQQLNKLKRMQKSDEGSEYHLQNLVAENASADADEIQVLLQKAIQSLPEKQKLVFTLRYYDDLPYEEISKIVEMSVGTLKTNYHYAKQKVEDYIKLNYTE